MKNIDLTRDDLQPARQLLQKRLGRNIAPSTLWRWALHGTNGARLETVRVGRSLYTTDKAVVEFMQAQQNDQAPTEQTEITPELNSELRKAGLL